MTGTVKTGNVELLASAVRENPASPAIDAYLESLGLDAGERASVAESIRILNDAVVSPSDSPVPSILSERWG